MPKNLWPTMIGHSERTNILVSSTGFSRLLGVLFSGEFGRRLPTNLLGSHDHLPCKGLQSQQRRDHPWPSPTTAPTYRRSGRKERRLQRAVSALCNRSGSPGVSET